MRDDVLNVSVSNMELGSLLDLADATWGVNHRVLDSGVIEIFRLDTRIFRLRALAQTDSTRVTSSAGFDKESTVTMESKDRNALASVQNSLLALGTIAGSVNVNPDSKSVIVTDTPESIASMESFLDIENKRLSRRVTLLIEEIYVSNKNDQEAAINWSVLLNKVKGAATTSSTGANWVNSLTSPAGATSANAGSIGFNVQGSGGYAGSSVVLQALNEMGLTVTQRSFPVTMTNGSTHVLGLPTIFDYVQSVSSNVSASTVGTFSAPTVVQKEDKLGAFLTVTPEAQDDGQILISMNLVDRSGTLNPYTVQVNGVGTTVQQRNFPEMNWTGRTVLRAGVTQLVGGLDEVVNSSNSRRLDENAPIVLGGGDVSNRNKRHVIILMTAIVEDNI